MDLSYNTWCVRWFFWSCQVCDRFWPARRKYPSGRIAEFAERSDLCRFVRIMLGGSLIFGLVVALYVGLIFVWFALPFILFPVFSVLKTVGISLGIVIGGGCLVGVLSLIFRLIWIIAIRLRETRASREDREIGFRHVLFEYISSFKQRICPVVRFKV